MKGLDAFRGLAVMLVAVLLLGSGACAQETRDLKRCPVRFAVIGDRTGDEVEGIYPKIVSEIERLKPEFVMTVGDMIEGYTENVDILDREWKEYLEVVSHFSMPLYFTPGNHDITTDGQLESYRKWTKSEPYYSFDHDGIHMVVLDNSRSEFTGEFPGEQIDWLIADLEQHKEAAFTFVFNHKPFCYRTLSDNKPDTLHSIYVKYGVDVVFSGHWHRYFVGEWDGVKYISMGTSGGRTYSIPGDLSYHFVWVTASDEISIAPIEMGAILPWDTVHIDAIRAYETARGLGIAFTDVASVTEEALEVPRDQIGVDVRNFDKELPLIDTVEWSVPAGWTVEPLKAFVKIAPGESVHLTFDVACDSALYPKPELAVDFPYTAQGTIRGAKELRVARSTMCVPVEHAPVVDGKIDESVWKTYHGRLLAQDGGDAITDATSFYFAYDKDNIYFAAHCVENRMDSLFASLTGADAAVYGEDCVGFLYRPGGREGSIYQLYVNPLGTTYDQQIEQQSDGYFTGDPSWNGTYEIATSQGDGFWEAEIRIPLSQFGVSIESGKAWDFNFRRKQRRLDESAGWQVPHTYDPNEFGLLIME